MDFSFLQLSNIKVLLFFHLIATVKEFGTQCGKTLFICAHSVFETIISVILYVYRIPQI